MKSGIKWRARRLWGLSMQWIMTQHIKRRLDVMERRKGFILCPLMKNDGRKRKMDFKGLSLDVARALADGREKAMNRMEMDVMEELEQLTGKPVTMEEISKSYDLGYEELDAPFNPREGITTIFTQGFIVADKESFEVITAYVIEGGIRATMQGSQMAIEQIVDVYEAKELFFHPENTDGIRRAINNQMFKD